MPWGFPTLSGLAFDLERKINADYRKLLADVLKEEWEFGSRSEWRTPVKDVDTFMKQMKIDLSELNRLQDESKLNKNHLAFLKDLNYRLFLLDKAEQQFRKVDIKLSKEIQEIIVNMTVAVQRLMKAVVKG